MRIWEFYTMEYYSSLKKLKLWHIWGKMMELEIISQVTGPQKQNATSFAYVYEH